MKKKPFNAILFDFGNVIIDIDSEVMFQGFSEASGKSVTEIKKRFDESQLVRRYESGYFLDDEFREVVRQTIGFPFNDEEVDRIWNSLIFTIPTNRLELIRFLATRYPIYLLSNTNSIHIHHANNYLKKTFDINRIEDLFTKTFLSHEIGMWKPDEEIYRHVIEEMDQLPENILFFDDLEKNVLAAAAVGINAVQVTKSFGILDYFNDLTH